MSAVFILTCAVVLVLVSNLFKSADRLDHIPTIGPSAPLFSYLGALKFLIYGQDMIQEGYARYRGSPFKIPLMRRWLVIVGSPTLVEEVRKAPDDQLSFVRAVKESLQLKYTLQENLLDNPFHVGIIRTVFTRNLAAMYPEMLDEVVTAFGDNTPLKGNDWSSLPGMPTVMKIVSRGTNRLFVGLPLCRNEEWLDLCVQFTIECVKKAGIISMFPMLLHPVIGRLVTGPERAIRRGMVHMKPIVEYRLRMYDEYGKDWPGKPNDLLTGLMDEAKGEERTLRGLTLRILAINFAAIHTTAMIFTHVLFNLAADPKKYLGPLRDEVETIVSKEGWSKAALNEMRKVDSFIKESTRIDGLGPLVMSRHVARPFTFSDGTYVPPDAWVAICAEGIHHDPIYYPDGSSFIGFRFADGNSAEAADSRSSLISTSPEWLAFGHGRHACAGRFFASNLLKSMLAHLVVTYDIKFENEGVRPRNFQYGELLLPHPTANVMFRKRQTV